MVGIIIGIVVFFVSFYFFWRSFLKPKSVAQPFESAYPTGVTEEAAALAVGSCDPDYLVRDFDLDLSDDIDDLELDLSDDGFDDDCGILDLLTDEEEEDDGDDELFLESDDR